MTIKSVDELKTRQVKGSVPQSSVRTSLQAQEQDVDATRLSSARPQTSSHGHKKSGSKKHNNFMTEDQLIDTLNLKTSKGLRNGMQKPSLRRHG